MRLIERRVYTGEPIEKGGTSIPGKVAPPIEFLWDSGYITEDMYVLDYGAGKYSRNADFLRAQGVECYAYDPFNYNGSEGWEMGTVSNKIPRAKFDVGFTAYVLNVVDESTENYILSDIERRAKTIYHAVRGEDMLKMVQKALARQSGAVYDWWVDHYGGDPDTSNVSDQEMMDFLYYGVKTSERQGGTFQRWPDLGSKGYSILKRKGGSFILYSK